MPRKSGSKQKSSSGRERNVPVRIQDLDERLVNLEKDLAKTVEEVAANAVPEHVRAEMHKVIVRWAEDLDPK